MSTQEATVKKTRVSKKAVQEAQLEPIKVEQEEEQVIKVQPKQKRTQKSKEEVKVAEPDVPPVPTQATSDNTTDTQKPRRRKNVSMDDIKDNLKFNKEYTELHDKIENITNVLKSLRTEVRGLRTSYMSDINLALKQKRVRITKSGQTGFVKPRRLSDELCSLIDVPKGTEMSIPDYTKRFYDVLRARNLFYENDKRVFRADAQLLKLFELPASVNESVDFQDKNGFNFSTLQTTLSKTIKRLAPKAEVVAK
jgi:hypothetical protein